MTLGAYLTTQGAQLMTRVMFPLMESFTHVIYNCYIFIVQAPVPISIKPFTSVFHECS
jgi:hypothetical protein